MVLDPQVGSYALDQQLDYLRDTSASLDAAQAQNREDWQALHGQPNFGFTTDAIWLRLVVDQTDARAAWRLEIRNAMLEDARLYTQLPTGSWTEQRSGHRWRHSEWPLHTRSPVFALDLPVGQHTVLLRLVTRPSLSSAIHLWESNRFLDHAMQETWLWGGYFGMYGLSILVMLLFWKWARETLNGWYVPYATVSLIATMLTAGYPQNMLDWSGELPTRVLGLSTALAVLLSLQFSSMQLELPKHLPRLNRWLMGSVIVLTVVSALWVSSGHYGIGMMLIQSSSFGYMLVFMMIAFVLWQRGHEQAQVFLIAFGFLYAGALIRFLRNLGWIAPDALNESSFQIGSLVHTLVLCLFIAMRYAELRISLQVERKTRERQREFVAMVSHEYRTPLAIINTSAQQLAAQLDGPREKSLQRCANIRSATQRMNDLLDIHLSTERLDATQQALHLSACHPRLLIEKITADWPAQRLRVDLHDLPARLVCDAALLEVALRNLLTNADRHAPADSAIDLWVAGDGRGGLRLRVSNTGEDIAPDELPLVFQKYFRGRATRQQPGAGLGLFLVHRIAHLHGGQVSVRSANGRTEFEIQLPRASGTAIEP